MKDWTTSQDVQAAFANQVSYCRANGATITADVVAAVLANLDGPGAFLKAVREWPGKPMADALPLRVTGGLHALHLAGAETTLAPLYAGEKVDAEALIAGTIARHDAALLPWLDGPPQTNEMGRSANYAAALLWLVGQGLHSRFDCIEIGSSAGVNLMMDRYHYTLGGVGVGPMQSEMWIEPEWRGPPPPEPPKLGWDFVGLRGCDVAPVDLTDPAQLLRLKAYVWPEHRVRFERLAFAAYSAGVRPPDLVQADAAEFVEEQLTRVQGRGTLRVVMHSIVWQYLGEARQARITAAIEAAGAAATVDRPLAWIALEANRETFQHELVVRHWPGRGPGDGAPQLLARAHAHGAWVEWLA